MAFSEIELERIDKEVGGLCKKRSPAHIKDKFSLEYRIKGHEVIVYERRPQWDNPNKWIESPDAKLKYVRTSKVWQLFWQRANGKWVGYESFPFSNDLRSLVEVIDADPHGCFFG
jgi:hypothetical protein